MLIVLNFSLSKKDAECAELLSLATRQQKIEQILRFESAGTTVAGIRNIDASCTLNRHNTINYARNTMLTKSMAMDGAVAECRCLSADWTGVITVYSNVNATFYVKNTINA